MTPKTFKTVNKASYEDLAEIGLWPDLTDEQKTRVIRESNRLADVEEFLAEFQSLEQPTINTQSPLNRQA